MESQTKTDSAARASAPDFRPAQSFWATMGYNGLTRSFPSTLDQQPSTLLRLTAPNCAYSRIKLPELPPLAQLLVYPSMAFRPIFKAFQSISKFVAIRATRVSEVIRSNPK
jgi:hypothetical protein